MFTGNAKVFKCLNVVTGNANENNGMFKFNPVHQ